MALTAGDKLGPYEIRSLLGKGGMGEVYKANDTRLDRIVAVKVSSAEFSERFEREARAVAALNHSNICTLHDVGPNYLVMEYIEGTPLKGPLPVDQALKYAVQICDALAAAHRKGITHRDLKPANILVTKAGVKLLDFGLAKFARAAPPARTPDDATLTMALTGKHEIVGTLYYMSPEQLQPQANGQEIDGRSDIFSFGAVLYEMLTGKRAFEGASMASVIAAIMERPAPSIATVAPPALDRVLQTCLAKDPDERFQSARDLKLAIEWSLAAQPISDTSKSNRRERLAYGAAAAVLAVLAAVGWTRSPSGRRVPQDLTLTISPPSATGIQSIVDPGAPVISPDGKAVVYRDAKNASQLRRLDSLSLEQLSLPSGLGDFGYWSSDSKSFMIDSDGELWQVRLPGGASELIAKPGGPVLGASRGKNGDLLYTLVKSAIGLFTIPANGGTAQEIKLPGLAQGSYYWPEFLPGTNDFLVAFTPEGADEAEIYLATLRDGKPTDSVLLMRNRTAPHYTAARGGRLLFVRDNILHAQKLNPSARRLEGEPEAIMSDVSSAPEQRAAKFSVSADGVLAWRPGRNVAAQVTTFDRFGKRIGISGPPAQVFSLKLSTDERHLLITGPTGQRVVEPDQSGELMVGRLRSGITSLWAPDNRHFLVAQPGRVLEREVSGGAEREVAQASGLDRLEDVTPDGKVVLYTHGALASEVFAASLDGSSPPRPVLQTGEKVYNTRFSPDARWIVYEAYTPGRHTGGIYVQPFPGPRLRRQISPRGRYPVWRKDGREIVFLDQEQVWSIAVAPAASDLTFAMPKPLFRVRNTGGVEDIIPLAITRDGSRIYLPQMVEQADSDVIHIRTGWGRE